MDGILVVDKAKGMTSHDVIYKIKKQLKFKKIGHAGTLDPLTTGVLVVLVNGATKLSNYLINDDKEYICKIVLGKATDTEDVSGKVIASKKVDKDLHVDQVLDQFIGEQKQVPPMYSSVRHHGRKLYEIAREGMEVKRKARKITIYDLKRISEVKYFEDQAEFEFKVHCSKGTYIRTLCVEIGKALGYPAYMQELRRTKSGIFSLRDAFTLEEIKDNKATLINMLAILKDFKIINVNDEQELMIKHGKKLALMLEEPEVVLAKDNKLLAIYERNNGLYRAKRVWI